MLKAIVILSSQAVLLAGCASLARPVEEVDADHVTLIDAPEGAAAAAAAADDSRGEEFDARQTGLITDAVRRANSITSDTTFVAVLREMEIAREIDWGRRRRRLIPRSAQSAPTAWLVGRFATEGNYRVSDVGVGTTFSYPPTTAVTTACIPFSTTCALVTHVSPAWVTRTSQMINALANTLVHERVHSYGQMHGLSQKRGPNMCDAAYVIGDLAESLLRRRDEGAPIVPRQVLCRKLRRRLVARGVVAG
ncbi:MAG TPA: hypothetical protein VFR37_10535 [Longimicrobium sp.]|nr:hypothetical protein [Longimicrobium sp.]